MKNTFNFAFALSILSSDNMYTILVISLLFLLPFFFVQLLDTYVVIGRKMKINDYDLYYFVQYFDANYATSELLDLESESFVGGDIEMATTLDVDVTVTVTDQ